jgi:uncharacterized protein
VTKSTANQIPEFVSRHRNEIALICRRHEVVQLELFGSAVTEQFDPDRSDLDFLVEFDFTAEPGRWLHIFFSFKEALEELFARPVDLVSFRAVRNPYLKASIEEQRTLLYAA